MPGKMGIGTERRLCYDIASKFVPHLEILSGGSFRRGGRGMFVWFPSAAAG